MLVSLTSVNLSLLYWVLATSTFFLTLSVTLCLTIMVRRVLRNWQSGKNAQQKEAFSSYLSQVITNDSTLHMNMRDMPDCNIQDMTAVFLHYFRTLKGRKLDRLKDLLSGSDIEQQIIQSSHTGLRGSQMRAVRTLSHLHSQSSVQVISDNLSSDDKYIRLTAARCLVRRKGILFLDSIIESYIEAFPNNHKLLAAILSDFGHDAVPALEDLIKTSKHNTVIAGSLGALTTLMPARTGLELTQLMASPSDTVRSNAISFAAVTEYKNTLDLLRAGLADDSIAVKISAAKTACKFKKTDLTPELLKLTTDGSMWTRYWALRAIWASGQSGQQFVRSLSKTNPTASDVMLEMSSGYV